MLASRWPSSSFSLQDQKFISSPLISSVDWTLEPWEKENFEFCNVEKATRNQSTIFLEMPWSFTHNKWKTMQRATIADIVMEQWHFKKCPDWQIKSCQSLEFCLKLHIANKTWVDSNEVILDTEKTNIF